MNDSVTRRRLLTATTTSLAVVSVAGCLGDGDDDSDMVPEASFEVVEDMTHEEPPRITVAHAGEPLTTDNTHSVEIRSDPGGGDQQARRVDAWAPPTDGAIDGDEETFAGIPKDFESEKTIRFVWISPEGEREAELDSWDPS